MPAISAALPALRAIAEAAIGQAGTIRLAVTAAAGGLDLALHADEVLKLDAEARARIGAVASDNRIQRVTSRGELIAQTVSPRLSLGGALVELPPASFIQATAEAEATIAATLAAALGKAKRIADLFCGLGTFTYGLARRARVLACDGDMAAIEALKVAARATPGLKPIEARVRDLLREPLSRTELTDIDAVVLDPPRAGAKAQAEALARAKVPVIGYVSCNPATLARDCRILVDGGYAIERVIPIDQFLWSAHVEAVAVLRRR